MPRKSYPFGLDDPIGLTSPANICRILTAIWSYRKTNATLWGLYGRMEALWISHPRSPSGVMEAFSARSLCRRVGMQCPPYVVSNDVRVLNDFAHSHRPVVLKPVHELTTCFELDGKSYSIYVKRFTCDQLAGLFENRPLSPVMLQQYISKQCDVRVTVIGTKNIRGRNPGARRG